MAEVSAHMTSTSTLEATQADEQTRQELQAPLNQASHDVQNGGENEDLDFDDLPPFPKDVPTVPLLRISLGKLANGEQDEIDRLWEACCEIGFFYLDLRGGRSEGFSKGIKTSEHKELIDNPWGTPKTDGSRTPSKHSAPKVKEVEVDGAQLLDDASALFGIGKGIFDLPREEKLRYDFSSLNSYMGYKGYGDSITDKDRTPDRNEFYNTSKDDILGLSKPLPAPDCLGPHRELLESFIKHSHAVVNLLLRLLNARLDLPPDKLPTLHRLSAVSGDQIRWVYAPPQPMDDKKVALGAHSDFGSVTILFNQLGGLQVLPPKTEEWKYVKPLKGHAIVNLGDAMVKFSAGLLRSNVHRVVSPPGEQAELTRMSLVYFARPEDDVILKALTESKMINEQRRVDMAAGRADADAHEVTSKDWILRRAQNRRGADFSKSLGTEERLGGKT